jgi:formate-dependent nitrite reductase membrane component NrfD
MKGKKMNQEHSSTWGWTLYTDFFLGALGGGLLIVGALATLFRGPGSVNAAPFLTSVVAMGVGSSLLVIELGNPLRAWRVFSNPRSYLMVGASLMTISMGLSLLLASFYLPNLPWSQFTGIQYLLALLAALTGLGVALYPGLLLGEMVSRPFWRGPLLAPLFLLSGLSTGMATFCLLGHIWPATEVLVYRSMGSMNALFLIAQVVGWSTYVFIKKSLASPREVVAWETTFTGVRRVVFWGGFMGLGLVIPCAFYLFSNVNSTLVAHLLVLIGAFIMRGFVVTADEGVPLSFST